MAVHTTTQPLETADKMTNMPIEYGSRTSVQTASFLETCKGNLSNTWEWGTRSLARKIALGGTILTAMGGVSAEIANADTQSPPSATGMTCAQPKTADYPCAWNIIDTYMQMGDQKHQNDRPLNNDPKSLRYSIVGAARGGLDEIQAVKATQTNRSGTKFKIDLGQANAAQILGLVSYVDPQNPTEGYSKNYEVTLDTDAILAKDVWARLISKSSPTAKHSTGLSPFQRLKRWNTTGDNLVKVFDGKTPPVGPLHHTIFNLSSTHPISKHSRQARDIGVEVMQPCQMRDDSYDTYGDNGGCNTTRRTQVMFTSKRVTFVRPQNTSNPNAARVDKVKFNKKPS